MLQHHRWTAKVYYYYNLTVRDSRYHASQTYSIISLIFLQYPTLWNTLLYTKEAITKVSTLILVLSWEGHGQ